LHAESPCIFRATSGRRHALANAIRVRRARTTPSRATFAASRATSAAAWSAVPTTTARNATTVAAISARSAPSTSATAATFRGRTGPTETGSTRGSLWSRREAPNGRAVRAKSGRVDAPCPALVPEWPDPDGATSERFERWLAMDDPGRRTAASRSSARRVEAGARIVTFKCIFLNAPDERSAREEAEKHGIVTALRPWMTPQSWRAVVALPIDEREARCEG